MKDLKGNIAVKWAEDVISGKAIAGEFIQLACKRFFNDLETAKDKGFYLDVDQGMRITNFAEKICRHWKGVKAGQPIIFEPHQQFKYLNFHGWRKEDGTPRFFTSYKQVARKNGKTTEEGIDCILHTINGHDGAQAWVSANKEEQARILIKDAGGIIQRSPSLSPEFTIYTNRQQPIEIFYPKNKGLIGALGQDSKKQDGFDPSKGVQDEFHEAPNFSAPEVILSGMGSQPNAQFSYITTAGFRKMACYELRENCIQVLKGIKTDDSLFTMIFEMDENDDWHDKDMWNKPNPNLGVSVYPDYLDQRFNEAVNFGGEKEIAFRTKNLNQWTNVAATWIPDEKWVRCNKHELNLEFFRGKDCYLGLDLAKEVDLNALVLIHMDMDSVLHILPFFWIPEAKGYDIHNKDKVDYIKWEQDGYVKITDGNVVDAGVIAKDIIDIASVANIVSMGYDRKYANHTVIQYLQEVDFDLTEVPQRATHLAVPIDKLESLVEDNRLNHGGNEVLRWMMSNVELYTSPEGDYKPHKGKSGGKIDGVAALINAIYMLFGFDPNELRASDVV